jgi:hypothetical protein
MASFSNPRTAATPTGAKRPAGTSTGTFTLTLNNQDSDPSESNQYWISIYDETDNTSYYAGYWPSGDLNYVYNLPSGDVYDIYMSSYTGEPQQGMELYVLNASNTTIASDESVNSVSISGVTLGTGYGVQLEFY